MKEPAADPYRQTDVIDARAPRFNQATIGSLALVAFLVDWWPLLAILATQLLVGLVFGRRYCVPCLFYFEVVQPRVGEGPIEDSRPPRFANIVGFVTLSLASISLAVGLTTLGWALGLLVAGLALLAAGSGVCAGCEVYKIGARVRGIRGHFLDRVDLDDFQVDSGSDLVVQFTHPLCTDCRTLERELRDEGRSVLTVDVSERPELARKYGVAVVPTAVAVTGEGTVVARLAG